MGFKARKAGQCIRCNSAINPGEDIAWRRMTGEAWHVKCTALPAPAQSESLPGYKKTDGAPGTGEQGGQTEKTGETGQPGESTGQAGESKDGPSGEAGKPTEKAEKLADALKEAIKEISAGQALNEKRIREIAREEAEKGAPSKTIEVKLDNGETVKLELTHKTFPDLLKLVSTIGPNGHRLNVYMYGPAGSGKSTGAKQASEALKLDWGYTSLNPQTPDSRLLGYMHAGGEYVASEFFKRYATGGVFCLDEIDNASASLVTTLNSMLENGHGAFPHGVFPRHKNFVCVCTANTIGRGGDIHYPERRALDGAFLERFVFLEWDYDHALTSAIVSGILGKDDAPKFMDWVKKEAEKLLAKFPSLIISPRAYIQGATLEKVGVARSKIVNMAIARGVNRE